MHFARLKRSRPMNDPHVVMRIGCHPNHRPQYPMIRQRLRPKRIDLENWRHDILRMNNGRLSGSPYCHHRCGCERNQCGPRPRPFPAHGFHARDSSSLMAAHAGRREIRRTRRVLGAPSGPALGQGGSGEPAAVPKLGRVFPVPSDTLLFHESGVIFRIATP